MRAGWGPPITDAEHERIPGFLVETRSDDDEDGRDRDDHDPVGWQIE